jgi:hypothetical protein
MFGDMQHRRSDVRPAGARKCKPMSPDLHRFRLGIQVERNFQQHSRKPNIVSGLSHLPRASGPLPEVDSVQNDLLFSSRGAIIWDALR